MAGAPSARLPALLLEVHVQRGLGMVLRMTSREIASESRALRAQSAVALRHSSTLRSAQRPGVHPSST